MSMFTLALRIGGYDKTVLQKALPRYFKAQGFGTVTNVEYLKERSGYHEVVVDLATADPQSVVVYLEALAYGNYAIPDDLATVDFIHISMSVVRVPENITPLDVFQILNGVMQSNTFARKNAAAAQTHADTLADRLERLEESVARMQFNGQGSDRLHTVVEVVNELAVKTFGHEMILTDEKSHNLDGRSKWLH